MTSTRALTIALVFTIVLACVALLPGWTHELAVQDDARQHVWWMEQWVDPALFQNDLLAEYARSVAPLGFRAIYAVPAALGVRPLVWARLLPLVLALASTVAFFRLALSTLRVPSGALVATCIWIAHLFAQDDLCSATSRSLLFPLLPLVLLGLHERRALLCALASGALALSYAPAAVLTLTMLPLIVVRWRQGSLVMADGRTIRVARVACLIALVGLVPFMWTLGDWGPTVSASQARGLAAFQDGGRNQFFVDDPFRFWISSSRSGLLPWWRRPQPGFVLALVTVGAALRQRRRLPAQALMGRLALASGLLYVAAHLLLFDLYLPTRYVQHSLPLGLALLAGAGTECAWSGRYRRRLATAVIATLVLAGAGVAATRSHWTTSERSDLHAALAALPPDVCIATLTDVGDDIPAFSRRSVLFSRETSNAYATRYHSQVAARVRATLRAHAAARTSDPALNALAQDHGVTHVLVHRGPTSPAECVSWPLRWQREFGHATAPPPRIGILDAPPAHALTYSDGHFLLVDLRALIASPDTPGPPDGGRRGD